MNAITGLLTLAGASSEAVSSLGNDLERAGVSVVNKAAIAAYQKSVVRGFRREANLFWRIFWFVPVGYGKFLPYFLSVIKAAASLASLSFSLGVVAWVYSEKLPLLASLPKWFFLATACLAAAAMGLFLLGQGTYVLSRLGWLNSFNAAGTYWQRVSLAAAEFTLPHELQVRLNRAKRVPGAKAELDVLRHDPFLWIRRGREEECIGYFNTDFTEP